MSENTPSTDRDPAVAGFVIRPMGAADIAASQALSQALRWPHRPADWEHVFAYAQGVVAEGEGLVVATAQRWLWGEHMATVGLVIVASAWQGRGIGRALMQRLLLGLEDRSVLLQATSSGRQLYEELGFVKSGELRQHQGIARPTPLVPMRSGRRLRPVGTNEAGTLATLDALARGMPRHALIRSLLDAAVDCVVLDEEGEARGFAVLRRFGRGLLIGPVVAPDAESAKMLIVHLAGQSAGRFTRIDVDLASGLSDWLVEIGLPVVGSATSMLRGRAPARVTNAPALFAVASQALC